MGSKAPKAPDLGPMAQGSRESALIAQQTAREQLDWSKEQDKTNRALLERVLASQEDIQGQTKKQAEEDRARLVEKFRPLEDALVKEFYDYGSPERMQQERGRAMADVSSAFDAQRRNALQRLESYGVDPSQTRNAALDIDVRTKQAAAQAGAASAAQRATEQTGRALRAEGINIGKGMPSNVAASYGLSLGAGNNMMANANQTLGASSNAMQGANSYLNTSIGGFGQAGNTMTQGFNNQMQSFNANQAGMNALMGGVGAAAGMMIADGGEPGNPNRYDSQPGLIDYGEGDGSGIDDQVPIQASRDEYIIPADVVRAKGVEFFDKLVAKYHTPAEQQREENNYPDKVRGGQAVNPVPGRADGGSAKGQSPGASPKGNTPQANALGGALRDFLSQQGQLQGGSAPAVVPNPTGMAPPQAIPPPGGARMGIPAPDRSKGAPPVAGPMAGASQPAIQYAGPKQGGDFMPAMGNSRRRGGAFGRIGRQSMGGSPVGAPMAGAQPQYTQAAGAIPPIADTMAI